MRKRTVLQRNFAGAFLGGFMGILTSGYLHLAVLPFGCFFGVIAGWWYQEIWQSVQSSYYNGVTIWNRSMNCVFIPVRKFEKIWFNIKLFVEISFKRFRLLLSMLASVFMWILRLPTLLIQWLQAHPMNSAYMIQAFVVLAYLALNALWIVPLLIVPIFSNTGIVVEQAQKEGLLPALYALGLIICVMTTLFITPLSYFIKDSDQPRDEMRKFYLTWKRYVDNSLIMFFTKELINILSLQILVFFIGCGIILWLLMVASVFLLLVVIPISVIIGLVKGIYHVSTKAGHWLCFGTTLVVTTFTAWVAYPYLNDARILWTVALFAGLISAGATEIMCRSLVWFFSVNKHARRITTTTLEAQLMSIGHIFWEINVSIGNKFLNALPTVV